MSRRHPQARWNRYRRGSDLAGRRALYIGNELKEADSPARREGIARRRILITTGRCPCGTRLADAGIWTDEHGIHHLAIEHEDGCPAIDLGGGAA